MLLLKIEHSSYYGSASGFNRLKSHWESRENGQKMKRLIIAFFPFHRHLSNILPCVSIHSAAKERKGLVVADPQGNSQPITRTQRGN